MPDPARRLNVSPAPPVEFERNFIKTAVCELRFPTLLELESRIPDDFQRSLRADYPFYERTTSATVGLTLNTVQQHQFRSRDQGWTVVLKSFAVAIETSKYVNFEGFLTRFERVLKAATKLLDTDFFTRVGIRYINVLPIKSGDLARWVNPVLVSPLSDGIYGDAEHFWQEVRGKAPRGAFTFRHGLGNGNVGDLGTYVLDLDFYDENGEWKNLISILKQLHEQSSGLFRWAVGSEAISAMGHQSVKESRP